VEDEWAGVPGRPATDLTADRLEPLVEVTMQFKELLFTESGRRAVLAAVEQVIPSLERRRDDGYEGPGEDIHGIVDALQGYYGAYASTKAVDQRRRIPPQFEAAVGACHVGRKQSWRRNVYFSFSSRYRFVPHDG
jgi:hypothetical protein